MTEYTPIQITITRASNGFISVSSRHNVRNEIVLSGVGTPTWSRIGNLLAYVGGGQDNTPEGWADDQTERGDLAEAGDRLIRALRAPDKGTRYEFTDDPLTCPPTTPTKFSKAPRYEYMSRVQHVDQDQMVGQRVRHPAEVFDFDGKDGWELVSVVPFTRMENQADAPERVGFPRAQSFDLTHYCRLFFKRMVP